MRILVACFGNVLRGDDGVGVRVGELLTADPVPAGVSVLDVGIGGIHLVQELLEHADALVVVDALDVGRLPGTVIVQRPDVAEVPASGSLAHRDEFADMHYATPARALMLAKAVAVMPESTVVVGAQVESTGLGEELSEPVRAALPGLAAEVRRAVTGFGLPWPDARPVQR